jgi:hypothetical protein
MCPVRTAAWKANFQYDGFGNLIAKVPLNGTPVQMPVNALTNQLTYGSYDLNANMTSGAGATLTYDVSNRITTASLNSGGIEYFQYAPDNKRVLRILPNAQQEFTFYGGRGEKLGAFTLLPPDLYHPNFQFVAVGMTLSFGGQVVEDVGAANTYLTSTDRTAALLPDRLGSNRATGAR